MRFSGIRTRISGEGGFTLLELILVISIFSVMALLVFPRITLFFSNERGNFIVLTSIIAKTFDEAYLKGEMHYLVVHLAQQDNDLLEYGEDIFSRTNGVSVVTIKNRNTFADSPHPLLKFHRFPESFTIEEVLVRGKSPVTRGSVLVPFYPQGASDNVIIHILVNRKDRWSVKISKMLKEPGIEREYINFREQP